MLLLSASRLWTLCVLSLVAVGAALLGARQLRGAEPCHISAPPATLPTGGVAVVELFTSEGCSSCPPADKALCQIVADSRKAGTKVYPLAFHVDYWNRLGWTDRFSNADYSDRQQQYAAAFGKDQVYTPQMIVNGSVEFIGSDSQRASKELAIALKQPATAAVSLAASVEKKQIHVGYSTANARGLTLNIAVVERGLSSDVKRGENGGRQLQHDNVVRAFEQIPADATGQVDINVPVGLILENSSVIAFVSDAKTRAVSGAASVDLVVPAKASNH